MPVQPDPRSSAAALRARGARATPARVRILGVLDSADRALSQHDIEAALGPGLFDRVTLYRALDRLVEAGLVLRSVDERRVSRFSAASAAGAHESHAHFRCERCGRVFCLADVRPARPRLPAGFRGVRIDLNVRGLCRACTESDS